MFELQRKRKSGHPPHCNETVHAFRVQSLTFCNNTYLQKQFMGSQTQRGFGGNAHNRYGETIFRTRLLIICWKKRHMDFKYVGCRRDICPVIQTSVQIWILGESEGHRNRDWSSDSPRIKAGRVGQSGKLVSLNNSSLNQRREEDSQRRTALEEPGIETIHKSLAENWMLVR